jgi:hypothetical protein
MWIDVRDGLCPSSCLFKAFFFKKKKKAPIFFLFRFFFFRYDLEKYFASFRLPFLRGYIYIHLFSCLSFIMLFEVNAKWSYHILTSSFHLFTETVNEKWMKNNDPDHILALFVRTNPSTLWHDTKSTISCSPPSHPLNLLS